VDNDCDGAIDSGTGISHDNFDDNDISDWSIVDGSWSVSGGVISGYASSSEHCGFHFWAGSTLYLVNSSTVETSVGSVSFSSGTYYDVVAEVSPGNVDLYFNGSLAYSGNAGCDSFTRSGAIGLQVHQSGTAYFDEICVEY